MNTVDDLIAAALIHPHKLLYHFTLEDLERFIAQDVEAVRWAYDKLATTEGASHAA